MNTNQPAPGELHLPEPILNRMKVAIRRMRRIVILRGLLAVAAVALGAILCVMAVDAATLIFSAAVRWSMTLAVFGAVLFSAYLFLYRPLAEKWSPQRVARLLETRHPEMEESISSAIELLAMEHPAGYRGSESLLAKLAEEASRDVGRVSPHEEFTMRTAKPFRIALLAAAGVLALLFALSPKATARLFARAVMPSLRLGNAYAGTLTVTPGNATIPEGEAVAIRALVKDARPVRAELMSEFADGRTTVERMLREEDNGAQRFTVAFPSVSRSFRYRVRAGRALSGYCMIDVVSRPAVTRLSITRHYPAYMGLEPETEDVTGSDRIGVLAGTEVVFEAQFNKPAQTAELLVRDQVMPGGDAPGGGDAALSRRWSFAVAPAAEPVPLSVLLTDRHGFGNRPRARTLVVADDAAPTIEIVDPSEPALRMQPGDILPILYMATDDFGIGKVEMLVGVDGRNLPPSLPPPPVRQQAERPAWLGRAVLDLAALQLDKARALTVQLAVADILPADRGGPRKALSRIIRVQIDQRAETLAKQALGVQEEAIRKVLDSTEKRLEEARKQAEANIRAPVARKPDLTEAVRKAAENVQHHAATAEAAMNELAENVQETAFAKLAPKIEETSQQDIAEARKTAELMRLTEKPEEPEAMAGKIVADLDDALAAIQDLRDDLDKTATQADYLADLAEIAEKERLLAQEAQQAEATAAPGEEPSPAWQQQQQDLAEQLAQLANENPEALRQDLAEQLRQARQLAEDAMALAARQEGARQAEMAIGDPARHAQADEALRAAEEAPAAASLDQRLAQAQRQIDTAARELAGQTGKLNELSRNLAMAPEARKALEQSVQALDLAQQHAGAAADLLQTRGEPAAEPPGAAKRTLEQAAAEARRQADRQAREAAQEKEQADAAHAAAMKAGKMATAAEKTALAADAANKQAARQAAQAAGQEAEQARQAAERQMRAATAARQASERAAERAQQAAGDVQAVEKQQAAAKKAMEGAAQTLQRMGKELAAQLGDMDALRAQWEAQSALEEAMAVQEQAQETQQAARQAQQQAQNAAVAEPPAPLASAAAAAAVDAQQTAGQEQQTAEAAQQLATAAQQEAAAAAEASGAAQQAMKKAGAAMQQAQRAQQQAAQSQQGALQAQAQQPGQAGETQQMQQSAQRAQSAALRAQQQALAAQQQASALLAGNAIPQQGQRAEQVGDLLDGQELAQALASARAAAQPPSAASPRQASRQMAQAAAQAASRIEALAQQAAMRMGMPASQMSQMLANDKRATSRAAHSGDPDGKGNQSVEAWQDIPMALRSLGISMADWIRISGWLRSEVASEARRNTSPEYRELVESYFREVARRGGAPDPGTGK